MNLVWAAVWLIINLIFFNSDLNYANGKLVSGLIVKSSISVYDRLMPSVSEHNNCMKKK